MSEVIFDIEVENLDSPFEREKLESLPKAILVELLVRKIKVINKANEYINVCKNNDMGIRYQRIEEILQGVDKE